MSEQRKLTVSVLAAVLLTLAIVIVGVISLDRDQPETSQAPTAPPTAAGNGEGEEVDEQAVESFVSNCGQCHTLAVAGTTGDVGPDLDAAVYDEQRVLTAIERGGRGSGQMPANLIEGPEAQSVAELIATDQPPGSP
jgi:mono/diheme cytochrome c family protein